MWIQSLFSLLNVVVRQDMLCSRVFFLSSVVVVIEISIVVEKIFTAVTYSNVI